MIAAMRAGAAAFVRISQVGQGRPQTARLARLRLGEAAASPTVRPGSASPAARMLPSIHLDNTSIEQHAKLDLRR